MGCGCDGVTISTEVTAADEVIVSGALEVTVTGTVGSVVANAVG